MNMSMITIGLKYGEVTLDINDILSVHKENEKSNLMGDKWPVEYFFVTKRGDKHYLNEEQYISLLGKLTSC